MIQITRLLARQLRGLVKRTLALTAGGPSLQLRLTTGLDGLRIQAQGRQHAVAYHVPGKFSPQDLWLPLAVLDDLHGPKAEPVEFTTPREGVLAVRWQEKGLAKTKEYSLPPPPPSTPFPGCPSNLTEHPATLITALRDAGDTTDATSTRYALGCIQLGGATGQIAATDGCQLLLQSGFTWGFDDNVLIGRSPLFASKDLPSQAPVFVGKSDTHVVFKIGPWTFWLAIETEGRFPVLDQIVPQPDAASTTLNLPAPDAVFFAEQVEQLPRLDEQTQVTVDLNGNVAVRAQGDGTLKPVELRLSNSTKSGEDLRICLDRKYLLRAATLGFSRYGFYGEAGTILAHDEHRRYVWMSCQPEGIVPPVDDCLRIESPLDRRTSVATSSNSTTRSISSVSKRNLPPPAPAAETTTAAPPTPVVTRRQQMRAGHQAVGQPSTLDQVLAMREQLRGMLAASKDLLRTLQAEKRQQRLLKSTLASLKQLQTVA